MLHERPAEQEFDLSVQAAQIIVRPALKRAKHLWIDPQQKRLSLFSSHAHALSRYW
jgi:hypothetical protein